MRVACSACMRACSICCLILPTVPNVSFLVLPLGLHGVGFFAQLGQLALDDAAALLRCLVLFFWQCLALDLELGDATLDLVDLLRHRVDDVGDECAVALPELARLQLEVVLGHDEQR